MYGSYKLGWDDYLAGFAMMPMEQLLKVYPKAEDREDYYQGYIDSEAEKAGK